MSLRKHLVLPAAFAAVIAAVPAQAQGSLSIGFGGGGCHSGFGVGFTVPLRTHRCWCPGHYETVEQQVWVPGQWRQVCVEPVYESCVDPCGNVTRVLVRRGYHTLVQDPGHYETRYVQVWVPGHYR
jgi:hypothetical protein